MEHNSENNVFMILKNFILKKISGYKFSIVKISPLNKQILGLIKNSKSVSQLSRQKFIQKLKRIKDKTNRNNFVFVLRNLDFALWRYSKNWRYKNEEGFFGLMERVIDLFNLPKFDFKKFKRIISPKEDVKLAELRYKIFRASVRFLQEYNNDFFNYFEKNKKPIEFCLNLLKLKKFQDKYRNIYFLKPNQLLYYELLLSQNLERKFLDELKELTVFADYKIIQLFLNLNLVELPSQYLNKIKNKEIIKSHSALENELRLSAILLGEKLSEATGLPSYIIDNILWSASKKIKLKIPHPRVLTIFY